MPGDHPEDQPESGKPPKLDMNAVWSRGTALARENSQLLGVLAGVFILLPSAFLNLALPSPETLEGPMNVAFDPSSSEEAIQRAATALGEAMGPFIAWAGVATVVQHLGYAAMMALMSRERPTVGQAILRGVKTILPIMVALLVFFIGVYAILVLLPMVLLPFGQAVAAFLGALIGVLLLLFTLARLALTMPVIVIENQMNPLRALARSWTLTSSSAGNVFGFWMLLIVAYFVIFVLVSAVTGLLAALAGQGAVAVLINGLFGGLFGALWGILICALAVSMHRQLSGPDGKETAREFE